MGFRIKKLPKSEKDMEEIVREISEREKEEHRHEEAEAEEHYHGHTHHHEGGVVEGLSAEVIDAMIHVMEHQLGELAQINEKMGRVGRSLEDLTTSIDELKTLVRSLIKLQLASMIEDRDVRKKLIEDIINSL